MKCNLYQMSGFLAGVVLTTCTVLSLGWVIPPGYGEDSSSNVEVPQANACSVPVTAQNPRAVPGKVQWRDSFEAACEASKQSEKPVLLFEMLGRLDEEFC